MTTSDGDKSLFSDSPDTTQKVRKAKAKTENASAAEKSKEEGSDDPTITEEESNEEDESFSSSDLSSSDSSESEESDDDEKEELLKTKDEVPVDIYKKPRATPPEQDDKHDGDDEEEIEEDQEHKNQPQVPAEGPYLFRRNHDGYLEIGFSTMGAGEGKFSKTILKELRDNFFFHKNFPFNNEKAIEFCYTLRAEVKRLACNAMTKLIVRSAQNHKFYFPGGRPVRTFTELKKCWKARERQIGSLRTIHRIMYSDWEKRSGWQDQMERNIMATLKFIYVTQPKLMKGRPKSGCIHKMIGHQLNELRRQMVRKTGYAFSRKSEPPYDEDVWHYLQRHPDASEGDFTVSTKLTFRTVQKRILTPPIKSFYPK